MSDFPALDAFLESKEEKREPNDLSERGLVADIPLQILGGARDAVQETLSFLNLDRASIYGAGYELPKVDAADTQTGALVRGGAQFVTGFIPALRAMKALNATAKIAKAAKGLGLSDKVSRAVGIGMTAEIAAMMADQVVFDPYEDRLSDLIQQVPALQNPITAYLESDPSDTKAEARLKVAFEGAGLGLLFAPIGPIFKRMKSNKVRRNIDEAFELAKKQEEARISKATQEIAEKTEPDDILKETPQGVRPFVNNEYLDTPDAIKNTLNSVTSSFEKTIDSARRGRMAVSETQNLADQMGMTVTDLTSRKKGQAFNAEEALAARYVLNSSADDLTKIARIAADPEQNSQQVHFAFQRALARHAAIQEQVMGIAAEAGRALRQFQIPANVPDKSKAIKTLLDEFGHGMDPNKLADMVSKLDTPEGLAMFARQMHKTRTIDQIMEAWINNLLSGPTTHAVNITSNSLVAMWTIPENFIAAGLGVLRKQDKVYFRESLGRLFGLVQGAKDGLKAGHKTFLSEEPSDIFTKIESSRYQAIPSKVFREGAKKKVFAGMQIPFTGQIEIGGKQVRIPGRLLQAEDEFFKAIGYRMEVNALAIRSGLDKGLSGHDLAKHIREIVMNPPEKIRLAGIDTARHQTFTKELGSAGRAVQHIVAQHPMLRFIMPFIRTPVNIVKFAAGRSPIGRSLVHVKEAYAKGGAARDIARARIYMGTAIGTAVGAMALEGKISGAGPSDPARKAALYNTGWQPYSIRIGNKWYAYNRLEPLGMMFGVAADFAEIYQATQGDEADEIGAMIVGSISKNLTSKTWLRGLSEIIMAIEDPDRYGERYIRRFAGTAVPTGVAQVARVEDPVLRHANTITEQIKSRIPGQSKELYPVRNVWGEPITLSGALGPDIVSPVYTSVISTDPVALEVARLGMGINKPKRTIRGIELTDDQYDRYVQISGFVAKKMVMQYVTSPLWPSIPDHMKESIIDKAINRGRRIGRAQLLPEIAPQLIEAQQQRAEDFKAAR